MDLMFGLEGFVKGHKSGCMNAVVVGQKNSHRSALKQGLSVASGMELLYI
jgi:hypothetical protein